MLGTPEQNMSIIYIYNGKQSIVVDKDKQNFHLTDINKRLLPRIHIKLKQMKNLIKE